MAAQPGQSNGKGKPTSKTQPPNHKGEATKKGK